MAFMDHKQLGPNKEAITRSILVFRSIEKGEDLVTVLFFHSSNLTFSQQFRFPSTEDAQSFVRDFSEESAAELAKRIVNP